MGSRLNPEQAANEMATHISMVMEALAPISEAAYGYKTQLEAQGWSPTVAEQMAHQFYSLLMAKTFGVNL